MMDYRTNNARSRKRGNYNWRCRSSMQTEIISGGWTPLFINFSQRRSLHQSLTLISAPSDKPTTAHSDAPGTDDIELFMAPDPGFINNKNEQQTIINKYPKQGYRRAEKNYPSLFHARNKVEWTFGSKQLTDFGA